ncbi:MAG: hypothetical protein AAB296_09915 [Candidatus Desantisbacteria bacterium]
MIVAAGLVPAFSYIDMAGLIVAAWCRRGFLLVPAFSLYASV